jgi:cytochrome c oxidase assembly protein subunit 15
VTSAQPRPLAPRPLASRLLALRPLALASLVANVTIVITGGAVRLTGSGLGCPTWPMCTDESYTATSEMGVHGLIEFSNRMLGALVGLIAIATFVAALRDGPRRPALVRLAGLALAGVLAQGLLGGVTVLAGLNPWTVAGHFVLSVAVIALVYPLWRRSGEPDQPRRALVPDPVVGLVAVLTAASGAVLVVGTLVTGAGPHAGDPGTPRLDLDLTMISQLHADAVFLLLGLSIAAWFALRAVGGPPAAVRAAAVLVGIELAQGLIGFVQYFTHLPATAVLLHMAGSCAVWVGTLAVADRLRGPAPAQADRAPVAGPTEPAGSALAG